MTERDTGHEPAETHDEEFAPVVRDADARGRTVREEPPEEESTGTGVPGRRTTHPAALPPDSKGVEEAEQGDASRPRR